MSTTNRTSGVWASPCTYVLKADICRSVYQSTVNIDKCCRLMSTLDVQLYHCVQRDMVDWAWGSVARSIGVSRYHLLSARRYASAGISCRRVSVTYRYCVKTAKYRIMQTTPHDSLGSPVFWCQISRWIWYSNDIIPTKAPNTIRAGKICVFQLVDKSPFSDASLPNIVFIRHDAPYPPERAGGAIRSVINVSRLIRVLVCGIADPPEGPFSSPEKGFIGKCDLGLTRSAAGKMQTADLTCIPANGYD